MATTAPATVAVVGGRDREMDRLRHLRLVLDELRSRYSPHGIVVPDLGDGVGPTEREDGEEEGGGDGVGIGGDGLGVGVEEIRSAQQEVHVVRCRRRRRRGSEEPVCPYVDHSAADGGCGSWPSHDEISDALDRGDDRLVVRIWHGSARWWNLNAKSSDDADDGVVDLARAEVGAYRLARRALLGHQRRARGATKMVATAERLGGGDDDGDVNVWENEGGETTIPRVLYFSHDGDGPASSGTTDDDDEERPPYAVFEYVGEGSSHFATSPTADCSNGNVGSEGEPSTLWHYDDSPATSMVKIREEFGYDEPHPRHGRVPADESLSYALRLVHDVSVPIHSWFLDGGHMMDESRHNGDGCGGDVGRDGQDVVARRQCQWALEALGRRRPPPGGSCRDPLSESESERHRPYGYGDMVELYERTVRSMGAAAAEPEGSGDGERDGDELACMFRLLLRCVERLRVEYDSDPPPPLPPVLCHLDLQPQNLLFGRIPWRDDSSSSSSSAEAMTLRVASVLDWEEAAYADPRFDLLLVCRKVVADSPQARAVWDRYSGEVLDDNDNMALGPIEPWLKLEGVHSVLSLLRQGVGDGGRGKVWETKPDLADKIRREFLRLAALGWTFCADSVFVGDGGPLAN